MTTPASHLPTLSLVGAGQLGRTMARLWHEAGLLSIAGVLTRSLESAQDAVAFIGAGSAEVQAAALAGSDLLLLATPDDVLQASCEKLAAAGVLRPGQVVFHCSGALSSQALQAAREAGASVASVHPIRSFAQPLQVLASFAGTWCGAEGDQAGLAILQPLFKAVGAQVVAIDGTHKTLYHAAAVFASNYLVTLGDAALLAYQGAGVERDRALQMIAPLMRNTLENLLCHGPEAALSGPIARGDMTTVARQQAALQDLDSGLANTYAALATQTLDLIRRGKKR